MEKNHPSPFTPVSFFCRCVLFLPVYPFPAGVSFPCEFTPLNVRPRNVLLLAALYISLSSTRTFPADSRHSGVSGRTVLSSPLSCRRPCYNIPCCITRCITIPYYPNIASIARYSHIYCFILLCIYRTHTDITRCNFFEAYARGQINILSFINLRSNFLHHTTACLQTDLSTATVCKRYYKSVPTTVQYAAKHVLNP